jgi:hypothetical protein
MGDDEKPSESQADPEPEPDPGPDPEPEPDLPDPMKPETRGREKPDVEFAKKRH